MHLRPPGSCHLGQAPSVDLSAADRIVRFIVEILIYLRHPRLVFTFRQRVGYWPRSALPLRFHEKFLWRKLFDHDPRHVELTDKLRAKAYVQQYWPDIRVAALHWQGTDPDQIPAAILAGDCAIKARHGSGMNLFVRDGVVDRTQLQQKTRRWLRRRHGRRHYEWAYSQLQPGLLAEHLLLKDGALVSPDYKLYIVDGECIYAYVKFDQHLPTVHEAVLDRAGDSRRVMIDSGKMGEVVERPHHWDRIVATAEAMGAAFDCVRVDLHEIDGELWFSELTFYSGAGYCWIGAEDIISNFNLRWDLRRSWFLTTPQRGWRKIYARLLHAWLSPKVTQLPRK